MHIVWLCVFLCMGMYVYMCFVLSWLMNSPFTGAHNACGTRARRSTYTRRTGAPGYAQTHNIASIETPLTSSWSVCVFIELESNQRADTQVHHITNTHTHTSKQSMALDGNVGPVRVIEMIKFVQPSPPSVETAGKSASKTRYPFKL